MLTIKIPRSYQEERRYVIFVVFKEFLGLECVVVASDVDKTVITDCEETKKIIVDDSFFSVPQTDWLKAESLPLRPLKRWNIAEEGLDVDICEKTIPVIYGKEINESVFMIQNTDTVQFGVDIFGSIFFMLTRYEEVVSTERDLHDRFPAYASIAYQEGFLSRPIVNEYLEILWAVLIILWPGIKRKKVFFRKLVSHDVDLPFLYGFQDNGELALQFARNFIINRSYYRSLVTAVQCIQIKLGRTELDPLNNFDMIMKLSEKNSIQSEFYFIPDTTNLPIDGNYDIKHPFMRKIINKIVARRHRVGFHPSYLTYKNADKTKKEFLALKSVCSDEGIKQETWGGRQHYLRWCTPVTFQNWNDAGLDYDSTLGFADYAGFRCGVCYEFPVFNLVTRERLRLIERPLIVMECTVLDARYMGLGIENGDAFDFVSGLVKKCKLYGGDFTLLWHNNRMVVPCEINLYTEILKAL